MSDKDASVVSSCPRSGRSRIKNMADYKKLRKSVRAKLNKKSNMLIYMQPSIFRHMSCQKKIATNIKKTGNI